jgi:hypothetical protein
MKEYKKMKKFLYIMISVLALTACSDAFLETENKNNLDVGSFFKTENDLQLAVNTVYTPLAHRGMFGIDYFLKINTLDPYLWFENPKSGLDMMIFGTDQFTTPWEDLYRGLFRTSDILANIPRMEGIVPEERLNEYEAQVRALRGMYYFYLVTWFNAPIYYDETNMPTNPLEGLPNGKPEQFWDKLEEDLTFAQQYLPLKWPDTELGRISKGGANAQLGKALLFKHYHYYLRNGQGNSAEAKENLKKAKEAFKRIIDSGAHHLIMPINKTKAHYQAALLSNFAHIDLPAEGSTYTSENNAESLWEVQYNDDNRAASGWLPGWQWGGSLNYQYFGPIGYKNLEIDPALWYEFETVSGHPGGYDRDPRANATCFLEGDSLDWRPETNMNTTFQSSTNSKMTVISFKLYSGEVPSKAIGIKKYGYPQFTDKSLNCAPYNIRVIRYADALLMYAEACMQFDGDADGQGLAALNQVRARVDMPAITALTPKAIIHERTVELATEGHYYNDLIRWGFDPTFEIDYDKIFRGNFNVNKHFYFPIPQSDINANKGVLKQNPGW